MAGGNPLGAEEIIRQAKFHLESLRAAGLEWLPAVPAPAAETAPSLSEGSVAESASNLFPESAEPETIAPAAEAVVLSIEERRQALAVLAGQVAGCTRCAGLAATRTQTVFGDGPPGVELCFIGEAPGADEDAQGKPFVGAAGQLLNRIIAACGLKREEVYICNIIKCRPPGNRTPLADEAAHCREYLEKQLELVRPKFICALGGCAAQNLLNTTMALGKLRGRFHNYRGIPVLCTYHPAFLLPHRSPSKKKDVWEDLKMLLAHMGRPVK